MAKISTIPEMEQFLLSKSSTDDFVFSTDGRGTAGNCKSANFIARNEFE